MLILIGLAKSTQRGRVRGYKIPLHMSPDQMAVKLFQKRFALLLLLFLSVKRLQKWFALLLLLLFILLAQSKKNRTYKNEELSCMQQAMWIYISGVMWVRGLSILRHRKGKC